MTIRRYFKSNFIVALVGIAGLLAIITAEMLNNKGPDMQTDNQKANRLIKEKSPYLLQHAYNPVDWYPWGEEAFAAAEAQDKPIFLSIGYSTCHWCHVMEHESFEDETVAALMNEAFINIKVDREERPDIDAIYMTACQALTGSGGWPLTVIMTPDKRPFYAATYIPKTAVGQRAGMMQLVPRIRQLWNTRRDDLVADAEKITEHISTAYSAPPGEALTVDLLKQAAGDFRNRFDPLYGGFSERPKFPSPHNLLFLMRYYQRSAEPDILKMVEKTLVEMRKGGIFDHVGYGFHRYATDPAWLLPHFEKMLYDQAMMIMAYTEAYQLTGKDFYRRTAEEVLTYVLRDMTGPDGGFYSAEDADSEGEEGKFYVWTIAEIEAVLGKDDAEFFSDIFNAEAAGNFMEEATGHRTGANIPHLQKTLAEIAEDKDLAVDDLRKRWEKMRQKLFDKREGRIHPLKDDKILTDWNGLMIAAMAGAARAFDEPRYRQAAVKATDFILAKMNTADNRLMHRYREGEVAINGYLDDYAFMIWGLLELYETTLDPGYLAKVLDFTAVLKSFFWDEGDGGYFFTGDDAEKLLLRKKDFYDSAIPSGNSAMMLNLVRLARLTGRSDFEAMAEKIGRATAETASKYPSGFTLMLSALDFSSGPSYEVVIVGKAGAKDAEDMLAALHQKYLPNKVLIFRDSDGSDLLDNLAPYSANMIAINDRATAYVCRNFACELPTNDVQKMIEILTTNNE